LELGELVAAASEDATKAETAAGEDKSPGSTGTKLRRQPARTSLTEHFPRERVVIAAPSTCPCCGGKLSKLGEDVIPASASAEAAYYIRSFHTVSADSRTREYRLTVWPRRRRGMCSLHRAQHQPHQI
jgi:hypothetical protein